MSEDSKRSTVYFPTIMNKSIIPGILTESIEDFTNKLKLANDFADRVCIDVIDGLFADNLTVMPDDMRDLDFGNLKIDIQLMVEEPIDYLGQLHLLSVDRVFGHIEKMSNIKEFREEALEKNIKPGLAFDLYTPLSSVNAEDLIKTEHLLLMSVKAGFSNQQFNSHVIEKIKELRSMGFEGNIMIDGGVNQDTIGKCFNAGANQFSITSAIWNSPDPKLSYTELTKIIEES
jgi:ribulose-phosphate 3-epimerase